MFWLNHVILGGVIASEPSVETLNGVEVMTLTLSTVRPLATRKGGQAHRFTVRCYGDIARYVLGKFRKGCAVVVDGELNEQSCVDEDDGVVRSRSVVVAHRMFSATASPAEEAALSAGYADARKEAENSSPSRALAKAQGDQRRRTALAMSNVKPMGRNSEMYRLEASRLSIGN